MRSWAQQNLEPDEVIRRIEDQLEQGEPTVISNPALRQAEWWAAAHPSICRITATGYPEPSPKPGGTEQ